MTHTALKCKCCVDVIEKVIFRHALSPRATSPQMEFVPVLSNVHGATKRRLYSDDFHSFYDLNPLFGGRLQQPRPRNEGAHLATTQRVKKGAPPVTLPTSLAGEPATIVLGGTGFRTREPAATIAPLPIVMLPRIVAAAPMRTLSLILGCLSPSAFPVPAQRRGSFLATSGMMTHVHAEFMTSSTVC